MYCSVLGIHLMHIILCYIMLSARNSMSSPCLMFFVLYYILQFGILYYVIHAPDVYYIILYYIILYYIIIYHTACPARTPSGT